MLYRKPILLALATGFGLRLLADPTTSDGPAAGSPLAPTTLNATVQDGEIRGHEQARRVVMSVGGRRLMLAVPQDFRALIANPEKVVLVNRDYSCVVSFRIAGSGSGAASSPDVDLCRTWLSAQFLDLRVQEEFSMTAANGRGPAFDLNCKVDGVARVARVTFIASPVGVLEFNSFSSPEKFESAKATLRLVLRGFRISDANGQLETFPTRSES